MSIVAEKRAYAPFDANDYRHQRHLLLALHSARPVLYRGQQPQDRFLSACHTYVHRVDDIGH